MSDALSYLSQIFETRGNSALSRRRWRCNTELLVSQNDNRSPFELFPEIAALVRLQKGMLLTCSKFCNITVDYSTLKAGPLYLLPARLWFGSFQPAGFGLHQLASAAFRNTRRVLTEASQQLSTARLNPVAERIDVRFACGTYCERLLAADLLGVGRTGEREEHDGHVDSHWDFPDDILA